MRRMFCSSSGVVILGLFLAIFGSTQAQLQQGFYYKSCPEAEKIVQDFVNEHIHNAPSLAAPLIRMHFHDCFIRVCIVHCFYTCGFVVLVPAPLFFLDAEYKLIILVFVIRVVMGLCF